MTASSRTTRWKLLALLLAIPLLLRIAFWFTPWQAHGWGVGATLAAAAIALLIIVIWLLLLSGLPAMQRLLGLALVALLALGLRASVRLDGHMGDFFPQLAWAWSPRPGELAAPLQPAGPSGDVDNDNVLSGTQPTDFPNFLGPHHSNWIAGDTLPPNWPEITPQELWRRPVGLGWSSFSVAGPYAYTMEQREGDEVTVCYEARTGTPIWAHRETARFSESMGGDGPRSTPSVHQGKLVALGATGILLCLDAATGELLWRRDTLAENQQTNLTWAKSGSPLILPDLQTVVITLGDSSDRSLAAYDLLTGEPRWRSGSDRPSYATPIPAILDGTRQLVVFNASSVSGHAPDTGILLWSHDLERAPAHNASPLVVGPNQVLVGIGYGRGSHLLDVRSSAPDAWEATRRWHSNKLKPKFADMVHLEDHVYGLDEGRLVCLRLEDGQRAWRGTRFQHGQILGVGQHLLIQAENGDLAVAKATPESEEIVHRFDGLSSKTWNHPVLAGRLLLIRNDREAAAFLYPEAARPETP